MSQERTLAFLQNFYTDVTLYVAAEAGPAAAAEQLPAASAPPAAVTPAEKPAFDTPPVTATQPAAELPAHPAPPATALPPQPAFDTPAPKLPSLASIPVGAPVKPVAPVVAPAAPPPPPPPSVPAVPPVMLTTFSTLGSNPEGVTLLFRLPAEQFKKLPRNVFLNKMLQALDLVMADVVLVNVESHLPVALSNLRREISAGRVLAFGKNLLDVAVRTTQIYEPVQFASLNLSYLAAAEVELLEYDSSLKKRLWSGLQRMFLA